MYQDADIYLIDDILATMDLAMATEIFNKCVLGYLKAKTVLIITDRPRFLQKADQIIILKDVRIYNNSLFLIYEVNYKVLILRYIAIIEALTN